MNRPAGFVLSILCLVLFVGLQSARAQNGVEVLEEQASYLFNESLHFTANFESAEIIQEGFVLFRFTDAGQIWVYEGDLAGNDVLEVAVALSGENNPQPYSSVEYWYRFATDHGDIYESQHYSFEYEDNRYTWQTIERGPWRLEWHNGDQAFADAILASADLTVMRMQALLPLQAPESALLRVYDSAVDVQLLAQQSGFAWQAGHTDPAAGLLLFSLPPGAQQSLEIQRQVPHELAHLMLFQWLGADAYHRLPAWLNEGIASSAELYSDPVQQPLLQLAAEGNSLIPLLSLCSAFPQDEASARLAYAETASFVNYLVDEYNPTGFRLLVEGYAVNGDCLDAPTETFGKDLLILEAEWRSSLLASKSNSISLPWQAIITSGVVAVFIFVILRVLSSRRR